MVSSASGRGTGSQFWCADIFGTRDCKPSALTAIDDQIIANIKYWPRPLHSQAHLIDQMVNTPFVAGAINQQIGKIITDTQLVASMSKAVDNSAGFNATAVQSVTVYGEIQTTYAETLAVYKTTVSYIRDIARNF